MFLFQIWRLVALFLPSLSVSGLPRAVQVRPTLSPLSGVPGPEHAQTGSGKIRLGRALALPAAGRVSDGEQPRRACSVLSDWKARRLSRQI